MKRASFITALALTAAFLLPVEASAMCEVWWGKHEGVYGGSCADLAGYAPPGWLCRDVLLTSGGGTPPSVVKNPDGTAVLVVGRKRIAVLSDKVHQFFQRVRSERRRYTEAEWARATDQVRESDDGRVSERTLNDLRKAIAGSRATRGSK